jgi:hypothetical protein
MKAFVVVAPASVVRAVEAARASNAAAASNAVSEPRVMHARAVTKAARALLDRVQASATSRLAKPVRDQVGDPCDSLTESDNGRDLAISTVKSRSGRDLNVRIQTANSVAARHAMSTQSEASLTAHHRFSVTRNDWQPSDTIGHALATALASWLWSHDPSRLGTDLLRALMLLARSAQRQIRRVRSSRGDRRVRRFRVGRRKG